MMQLEELKKNADRFTGFADVYESARPAMPSYPVEIITRYLGRTPECVVDIGCGTGLSTAVWKGRCGTVIGVEPGADMIGEARKRENDQCRFVQAFAHDTGLPDASVDAVVSSQSFHWMEPVATLAEINRILKDGGIFATVDCDWPPAWNARGELLYKDFIGEVGKLEAQIPELTSRFRRWSKNGHLDNIRNSGHFFYCRELTFANREMADAERLIRLALSQGGLQNALNNRPELIVDKLEQFKRNMRDLLGPGTFPIDFSYRMRIGVKPS